MERRVDLHVHTYYSDGTFSPEEVVREAKTLGLSALAISDHDCTDGIEEAIEASQRHGLEVIPAVEISCEKEAAEIHILGYFIDYHTAPMKRLLKALKESRIRRMYDMIDRLKKYDINIPPRAVFAVSKRGTIGRLHLATALYESGFVPGIKEAFLRYIGDHGPCYVRRFKVAPKEAIETILKSGGVPVYAHPRTIGRDDFIPVFVKTGLCGLEVYHTDHSKSASRHYAALARKYGLIATGGSDCHGAGKGKVLMGGVTMPYRAAEELRSKSGEIRGRLF